MERRAFLSLLAAAPIAALAPLPKFLPLVMRDHELGISIRFVKQWDVYRDAPYVDYETVKRYEHYVSLPRTEEEKRATEMVNAARERYRLEHERTGPDAGTHL